MLDPIIHSIFRSLQLRRSFWHKACLFDAIPWRAPFSSYFRIKTRTRLPWTV